MIYIYTQAYNATKTFARSIESVLNQTHHNFIYHLCDNGSTNDNKTWNMILSYAESDKRIVPELRNINHLHPNYKGPQFFWLPLLMSWCEQGNDDDFFCALDADDEYKPNFFEKTLRFIEENSLDVAACGSDFIDVTSNAIAGQRIVSENLILDSGKNSDVYFPKYHAFMRPVWGKLYRFALIKRCDYENYLENFNVSYGLDTLFCMRAFSRAKRAGILAGSLHKYYVSKASSSHNFEDKRVISDQIMDSETRAFLIEKAGRISPQNDNFLKVVYFNAIVDTLNVLMKSNIPAKEKISCVKDIMFNEKTLALFSIDKNYKFGLDERMRVPVVRFLLAQKERSKSEYAQTAAEIILAMHGDLRQIVSLDGLAYIISKMPEAIDRLCKKDYAWVLERLQAWFKRHGADDPLLTELEFILHKALNRPDDDLFLFLMDVRKKRPQASKKLNVENKICEIFARHEALKNVSTKLAFIFSRSVCSALKGDFPRALERFLSDSQGMEIADEDAEAYVLLGKNLSASAGNTNAYVHFEKMWEAYLLERSRGEN